MELSGSFLNFTLNFNWLTKPPEIKPEILYSFKISNVVITKPETVIKSINGTHKAGMSNNEVKGIYFTETTVEYLPRGLSVIFPNLTHLNISNCGLKRITWQDLAGLKGLVGLSLYGNLIESLPDDLFDGMKNLQTINFSNNKIKSASSKLLKPVENQLKFANFRENIKINVAYGRLTPSTLNELKQHLDRCDKPKNPHIEVNAQAYNESLARSHELMWTTGKYSDFLIIVDKKEFKVHKNILGTQSSVFEATFEQKTEENSTEKLMIDAFGAEIVEEFLRFFYVPKPPKAENAIQVFKLASFFNMSALKDLCEAIIIDNINESNVVQVIELANKHKLNEMKKLTAEVVKSLFPGWDLQDSVFDDSEAIKKLIEAKCYIESINKKCNVK